MALIYRCKRDPDQIDARNEEIGRLRSQGLKLEAIAAEFNLTYQRISQILGAPAKRERRNTR